MEVRQLTIVKEGSDIGREGRILANRLNIQLDGLSDVGQGFLMRIPFAGTAGEGRERLL